MESSEMMRVSELLVKLEPESDEFASQKAAAIETGVTLNCDKHGDYQEKAFNLFGRNIKLSRCSSCSKEEREANENELKELQDKMRRQHDLKAQELSGVSPRNAGVRFKDYIASTEDQKRVYSSVYKMAKEVHEGKQAANVILTGKVGTGKTMLGNCVINSLFKTKKVKIIKLQDMLRRIKASYQQETDYSEEEAINKYSSYDLLILDEVGVSRDTDNDKILIFDVLDGRYQKMLPTMVISNLNIDGIKQTLGERVVDRLRDGGGVLLGCGWESQRK